MSTIVRTVQIDAAPAAVWAVLTDVERWPEWSPGTRSIVREDVGAFGAGCRARVTMKGTAGSSWRVTAFEPGRSFTWETRAMPGLRIVAGHGIEPVGTGSKVTLRLEMSGLSATLFGPLLHAFSRRNVEREAAGLKATVERAARR